MDFYPFNVRRRAYTLLVVGINPLPLWIYGAQSEINFRFYDALLRMSNGPLHSHNTFMILSGETSHFHFALHPPSLPAHRTRKNLFRIMFIILILLFWLFYCLSYSCWHFYFYLFFCLFSDDAFTSGSLCVEFGEQWIMIVCNIFAWRYAMFCSLMAHNYYDCRMWCSIFSFYIFNTWYKNYVCLMTSLMHKIYDSFYLCEAFLNNGRSLELLTLKEFRDNTKRFGENPRVKRS